MIAKPISVLLASLLIAALPVRADTNADPASDKAVLPLDELRTFADVFQQIRAGYVKDVPDSKLLEYAIDGMLTNLDPHSVYLTEKAFDQLQDATTGEFSGLGIEVGMDGGYVKIIAPIDDTPAAKAGLQSGDVILQIDHHPMRGVSLNEAIKMMRGPKGSTIELQIGRPGQSQPFDVTLTRDRIKSVSVRHKWLEPGYGYLRISQFQTRTGEDIAKQLKKLMEKPMKGLVLDLRNNPGGVMGAAIDVSNQFLDKGTIVYTEGRLPQAEERFEADGKDPSGAVPLVVLINGGSASASEIVAGALQDQGRAVVMGERSFGKGSVQTVLPISKDRAVKLTTALYFTPNGRSIQAQGIEPDVVVPRAKVTPHKSPRRLQEDDLSRRLDNASAAAKKQSDEPKAETVLVSKDNQLAAALTLLKGLHVAQRGRSAVAEPQPSE